MFIFKRCYRNVLFIKYTDISILSRSKVCKNIATSKLNCTVRESSSAIWLQVVQTGGKDAAGSVYIFTDSKRYLINAGENSLRLLRGAGLPTQNMDQVFLTGSELIHFGGLTNILLATQDNNPASKPIALYSPPNLEAFMETTRKSFQYLSKFDFVNLNMINERMLFQPLLNDDNFKISACAVATSPSDKSDMIYPNLAISYMFEIHQAPRRLDVEAAMKLGITRDMLHMVAEECQKGKSVELPTGHLINPEDVLHSEEKKQLFLIIDCPTQKVLKTLAQLVTPQSPYQFDLVLHLTPSDLTATRDYQTWLHNFHPSTQHILLNNNTNSNSTTELYGFNRIYEKLTVKYPVIFPALKLISRDSNYHGSENPNICCGHPAMRYVFRPNKLQGFEEHGSMKKENSVVSSAEDTGKSSLSRNNDFEVVFLGTGSRVSSILRNSTGILLNTSDDVSIMLDCGEGTYRQLVEHYGKDVDSILKQLQTVFVSHMHIDHHLGLANILLQRKRILGNNAYTRVIGPESLDLFLRYFEMLTGESLNFRFTQFWWLRRESGKRQGRLFSNSLGFSNIDVVPTKHSDYSHGIVIERNDWKIVYSADTRPCKQLIDAGQNATLLIHEATFADNLHERAKRMNHSTVSEAVKVGARMKAENTILTHFSSRHIFPCKVSRLPERVSFAFDHMTVQEKDLTELYRCMPSVENTLSQTQHSRTRKKNIGNSRKIGLTL